MKSKHTKINENSICCFNNKINDPEYIKKLANNMLD